MGLSGVSGKLTGETFELQYDYAYDSFRVEGTGRIQPSLPSHAAKYGPKRPPPLPPVTIKFAGYVRLKNRWDWAEVSFTLPDGRPLWAPDDKPAAKELTTAVVDRWLKELREAWTKHAEQERFEARKQLDRLYDMKVTLQSLEDTQRLKADAYAYATKKLTERLEAIDGRLDSKLLGAEPPFVGEDSSVWIKALYDFRGYLDQHRQEIVDFFIAKQAAAGAKSE